MKRIVIGTAGHIDHGKTTLIKKLTGIDCDRLKDEKERGITTELGFAHYHLSDDLLIGIVDVPGHEKFVRHMVAGAWGLDMVILVVAADEGVMPQTREHIDICEMLGLTRGIVALTKTDLADDVMIELVKEDIADFLKGRSLEGSPIVPVSASTGENIDTLRDTIRTMATTTSERSKAGIFRLPVDRVFTIKGLGTIVTGTCISGSVAVGDEIEIYPTGKRARIRNIQAYHENAGEAFAGQRVALNLQGIERDEIERGTIIGKPDTLLMTNRIDATFKYLKLPLKPIKTDTRLRFHIATSQTEARFVIIEKDEVEPGQDAFVQFVLSEPVAALPSDRFIIRGPYAIQTVGGGEILDISPRRHKRKTAGTDEAYRVLTDTDIGAKALYHMAKGGPAGIKIELLSKLLGTDGATTSVLAESLLAESKAVIIGKSLIIKSIFAEYQNNLSTIVKDFYKKNPEKVGISKEELRSRLPAVDPLIFQQALHDVIATGKVRVEKDKVIAQKPGDTASKDREIFEELILTRLGTYGLTPPGVKEFAQELNKNERYLKDTLERLVFTGRLVKTKGEFYFSKTVMEDIQEKVRSYLITHKEMSPTDIKQVINTSRKYLIPILEYLDEIKLTIRVGEKRVLRSS